MKSERVFRLGHVNDTELTFTLDTRMCKVRYLGAPRLCIEIDAPQQDVIRKESQIFTVTIEKVEDENSFTGYKFISAYRPYCELLKIGYQENHPVFLSYFTKEITTFDTFVFTA